MQEPVSNIFLNQTFVLSQPFASSIGYGTKIKMQLKPGFVPSIISDPKNAQVNKRKAPRKSEAREKRMRSKVCDLTTK